MLKFDPADKKQRAEVRADMTTGTYSKPLAYRKALDLIDYVDRLEARQAHINEVIQLASELGWNGVENSKLLHVFLRDYIEDLKMKVPTTTIKNFNAADPDHRAQLRAKLNIGAPGTSAAKLFPCSITSIP